MKSILQAFILLQCIAVFQNCFSQGWVAEVDLEFNHDLYAYEKFTDATLSFSGITASGISATNELHLEIRGEGPMSGEIMLTAHGLAWEPYDSTSPYSELLSSTYSGNFTSACSTGFFEQEGETPLQQIYIWIKIFPRLDISSFAQECDHLTLISNTCSPSFRWEISDNLSSNFKTISGKTTSTITLTRDELDDFGFTNPYGRKYFRVTGLDGTTSPMQPIHIYYPGPGVSVSSNPPRCHNGADGSVGVEILSSYPAAIDDYVITLFKGIPPAEPFRQDFVNNGSSLTFPSLEAGNYWIRAENNSNIGVYGNCWTDLSVESLINPTEIIASLTVSDFNGYAVKCSGGNEGTIAVDPSGGTGIYTSYEWTPDAGTTGFLQNLSEGTYQVKVKDSNNCWSKTYSKTLTAPEKLLVELISTGGRSGFDVSCHDKMDGVIESQIAGGVLPYNFSWSNGSNGSSLNDIGPGVYSMEVTDINGCQSSASLALVAPPPIDFAIAEITGITCGGDHSGVLEVQSVVNNIGQVEYLWSSGEQTKEITDKPAGIYAASIVDDQGCSVTKYHMLEEPPLYSIDIAPFPDENGGFIRCHGDDTGQLTAVVRDADGNVSQGDYYTWYRNGVEFASGTYLPTINGLTAATYKAEIIYRDNCLTEGTAVLTDPKPITITLLESQSPLCAGHCDGLLEISASGGTGSLAYQWSNGSEGSVISGICAGSYTAMVTDSLSCVARKNFVFEDPRTPALDLGGPIKLCKDQSHTLNPGGHWKSFSWGSNTGVNSSATNITINDAGTYWLEVISPAGCVARDTFILETSEDLLKANFLMSSAAMTGDTVVMIDITWPLPENILWNLPGEMLPLGVYGEVMSGQFTTAGHYEVSLEARLAGCRDKITKSITIVAGEEMASDGGRLGNDLFVKKFDVYPNPNEGEFDVEIEFKEVGPALLTVWNTLTGKKIAQVQDQGSHFYLKHIDLRPLSAGSYALRLDHGLGIRYLRFIVR